MRRYRLWGGVAMATLSIATAANAQNTAPPDATAALEARIAALEAELNSLKSEVAESRKLPPTDDVLRIPQPTTPIAAPSDDNARQDVFQIGDHTFKIGGFIRVGANVSRYSGGEIPTGNLGRDYYIPSAIPVGGEAESPVTDFNARQSRFWFITDGEISGHKISTRIEMDFQTLPGPGDNRISSPATPALRRGFVTIDNWLIGQEWTNFQNLSVWPETVDFMGPAEGTIAARQTQVRYTRGPLSVSIENPETTLTPFGGGARIIADDNVMPDLTARYAFNRPWGEVQLAGLLRQLRYEDHSTSIDSSTYGWGLSATARFKVGAQDDVRLMLTGGEGIGRYVGLNLSNDGVINRDGEIEPIRLVAGYAAYRHIWQPGLRSNLILSHQKINNSERLTGLEVNRSASSAAINLIWTPLTQLDLGAELLFAERELQSRESGDMNRLVLFAKYGF